MDSTFEDTFNKVEFQNVTTFGQSSVTSRYPFRAIIDGRPHHFEISERKLNQSWLKWKSVSRHQKKLSSKVW